MAETQLTAQDQFLIDRTEEAVRDGLQLERWFRERDQAGALPVFPLDLKRRFALPNVAEGFFDELPINGVPHSVMGCVQTVDFAPAPAGDAAARLREFVYAEFLPRAHWTYPDGHRGGFDLVQSLYRTTGGEYGKFPESEAVGCVDWRTLGVRYDWVLVTVRIHDFVMHFGPFTKRFPEAAAVAPNPHFVHEEERLPEDCVFGVTIGYPFVKFAPIPNNFGFGPGKFDIAIKTYSFFLTRGGRIRARMYFAAAPRCRKVFDFGKSAPDPVYGGAALLRRLTFGLFNDRPLHDALDAFMLGQHCRVHQALMDGTRKVWDDWIAGGAS
jgi:hypothetical protein